MNEGVAFYRCMLCKSIVNRWDIHECKGCRNCGHARIMPCNLTFWEKVVQVIKHPKVWTWHEPLQTNGG